MALVIRDVVATGGQAAIRFENRTPEGVVHSCDWVRVEDDRIRQITSFYDTAKVRRILSPDEQAGLEGDPTARQPRRELGPGAGRSSIRSDPKTP